MKKTAIAGLIAAGLAFVSPAAASTVALTGFEGGAYVTSGTDQLYGWFFDLSDTISVDALGVGDVDNDGLAIAHDVGIYRVSDQTLLVSATVGAGTSGTLLDGFRYVDITPFTLGAGSYVIVMTMPQRNADRQIINASNPTTSGPVSYVTSAFGDGPGLGYPVAPGAFAEGLFGPNFTFTTGGVPEPGTWALMLLGFGGMGVAIRAGRRAAAAA